MEAIQFFSGNLAAKKIRQLNIKNHFIEQWYHDNKITCYILYVDNTPTSFALLSTMNFDPLGKHSKPKTFNYIHTLEEYRRKGFATKLVTHIKNREEFSAFCANDESDERLFTKCNCINYGEMNFATMFRHPA